MTLKLSILTHVIEWANSSNPLTSVPCACGMRSR